MIQCASQRMVTSLWTPTGCIRVNFPIPSRVGCQHPPIKRRGSAGEFFYAIFSAGFFSCKHTGFFSYSISSHQEIITLQDARVCKGEGNASD